MRKEPFKPDEVEGIVNKAKRKSIVRNILISTIALLVVGMLLSLLNTQIVNHAQQKALEANKLLNKITQPNVRIGGVRFDKGILSGSYTFQRYKVIGNRVVPWGEEYHEFSVLGHNNKLPDQNVRVYETEEDLPNEENLPRYNITNGQRAMSFYHPWFEYKTIQKDISLIENAPDDALMEVAVSFDEPYSVSEVNEFLNLEHNITWFWVNHIDEDAKEQLEGIHAPEDSSQMYGFNAFSSPYEEKKVVSQNESSYLDILHEIKNTGKYDYLVDNLIESAKQNKDEGLILGVVLTGTKEELANLKDEKNIRAISLGAVAKKY